MQWGLIFQLNARVIDSEHAYKTSTDVGARSGTSPVLGLSESGNPVLGDARFRAGFESLPIP